MGATREKTGGKVEPNGIEYDASQIEMRYSGMPAHDWHPAALLRVVAEACSVAPFRKSRRYASSLEREIAVGTSVARLGEAGVDIDELIRCVFRSMYVGEFVRLALRAAYDLSNPAVVDVPQFLRPLGAYARASAGVPKAEDSFSTYFHRVVHDAEVILLGKRVAGWISQAELSDLLEWRFPTESEWESLPQLEVGSMDCESRWLADRFLLTYVGDWHTASLHEEFRWGRGTMDTSLRSEYMELRSVPADRLNTEISCRAVDGDSRDPRSLLMTGVQYLEQGEHEQAVALFQGALAVAPSQWVRNCLAFCLVPSDPAGAKLMIRELLSDGFDPALLYANLAAADRLLGNIAQSHAHARDGLERLAESHHPLAFLWGFEDNCPVLLHGVNLADYLRLVLTWRQ